MKSWIAFIFFGLVVCTLLFLGCKTQQLLVPSWVNNVDFSKSSDLVMTKLLDKNEIRLRNNGSVSCNAMDHYIYDPHHPELYDRKKIRVNFHFINSLDSTANFNPNKGIKYAKELIYYANGKLRDNKKMNLPESNDTPVYPVPYRYDLTPDPTIPGDEGVYFHYIKNPYFINEGKNANNYSRKIIQDFAINQDTVLNIFYMVHHPDSVRSKTYRAKPAGIALGKSVKLGVNGLKKVNSWSHAGLLNHEIGHVLGLSHSWIRNDGCDDTPRHPNCWNKGPAPCNGVVSNNVMDYNSIQMAFTPCQIARTYRSLTRYNGKMRDLVMRDICTMDKDHTITVTDTVSWNRLVDTRANVLVKNGGVLMINCRVNMPENSVIEVEERGTLILNNAHLYNECQKNWKGIKRKKVGQVIGNVIYRDTFYLDNTWIN